MKLVSDRREGAKMQRKEHTGGCDKVKDCRVRWVLLREPTAWTLGRSLRCDDVKCLLSIQPVSAPSYAWQLLLYDAFHCSILILISCGRKEQSYMGCHWVARPFFLVEDKEGNGVECAKN
jgi:hypothetical protein